MSASTVLDQLMSGLTTAMFLFLIASGFSLFSVFALMAVILIVRPWGLFGRPV